MVSDLFQDGSTISMYQEKNEAIGIAPKHNNSLKAFKYSIQKNLIINRPTSPEGFPFVQVSTLKAEFWLI